MHAHLYGFPLSHPSYAAKLMLEHKGIDFKTTQPLPGMHGPVVRLAGFKGLTVPALKLDGERIQGTLDISRALESAVPDPPLFPADPAARRAVEDAERWGESVLQPIPRRIFRYLVGADPEVRSELVRSTGLPPVAGRTMGPMIWALKKQVGATEAQVRADVAGLPAVLDEVDRLIAAGTIGGEPLNAADYQIGTSLRTLLEFDGVRQQMEGRPLEALARRVRPDMDPVPVSVASLA